MLLNTCKCHPAASVSRRTLLCAGGAGFVSALIAMLIGSSQTARAQALGTAVPEVDRLTVSIVTDNTIRENVPNEKRDGLAVIRTGKNLSPDKPPRTTLAAEWGLSMHAQSLRGSEERSVLVDFGYTPEVLLNNMNILKIDPARIDAMVLSHGHFDHFGGLVGFLAASKDKLKPKLPFFVGGEDCFCVRAVSAGQYGALDRKAITDANLSLMIAEGPSVVADHGFTTGKIAQSTFEKPLQPSKEKVGISGGIRWFPDKKSPVKNTGDFV